MGDHNGGGGRGVRVVAGRTAGNGYMSFKNDRAALTFMDQEYGDQLVGLSTYDMEGVQAYVNGDYARINNYLRREEPNALFFPDEIADLDMAFRKPGAVLRHDLTVTRAFGEYNQDLRRLKTGDTFTDAGFVSTTILPAGLDWGIGDTNVKIRVPKGTKALWTRSIALHPEESELLLGRGVTFRVVGFERQSQQPILEVIGQRR